MANVIHIKSIHTYRCFHPRTFAHLSTFIKQPTILFHCFKFFDGNVENFNKLYSQKLLFLKNMVGKKIHKFACFVNGLDMDYIEHGFGLDRFRCFLANLAATLYQINFGLICTGFLGLIILISVFGRIKENYRWFILNQAFWDLLVSYDFICGNTWGVLVFGERRATTCFYADTGHEYNVF